MATMIDVRDVETAAAKAVELDNVAVELEGVSAMFKSVADAVLPLTGTVNLNTQINAFLIEVSNDLVGIVPELQTIATQLKNAVASMQSFEELNQQNFLGNV